MYFCTLFWTQEQSLFGFPAIGLLNSNTLIYLETSGVYYDQKRNYGVKEVQFYFMHHYICIINVHYSISWSNC